MTESQAWRIVATELAERRVKTKYICILLEAGLAYHNLRYANDAIIAIPEAMRQDMIDRINSFLEADNNAETIVPEAEYDDSIDVRLLTCLMFSEMVKEES